MTHDQIAAKIVERWNAERLKCRQHQLEGHSLEDYDGPDLKEIIVEVLDKSNPVLAPYPCTKSTCPKP